MTREEWRLSAGSYEVSNLGRVRHVQTRRVRVLRLDPNGYLALNIWIDGRLTRKKVHLLVLEAFGGRRPEGKVARHLNGDATDNRIANLVWGTPAENMQDCIRHGRTQRGTRNVAAKLDEDAVREIRSSSASGQILAHKYGVSRVLISLIRRRKVWAWLH